jgi:chemotaxis protein MotB
MKKTNSLIALFTAVLILSSCEPIYKCGQPKPEKKSIFMTKWVQDVVDERDGLCKTVAQKENEIVQNKEAINKLNNSLKKLQKEYDNLNKDKISQSEELNAALKIKSEELEQKNIELQQKNEELQQKLDELAQKGKLLSEKDKTLSEKDKSLKELQQMIARQDSISKHLNDIIRNALLGFKSDELQVELKNGKVYVSMSDKLLFKSGSASIEDAGKSAIKVLADVLNKNLDIDISVEGHTDNIPIKTALYADNWDLSVARATSIVRILTSEHNVSSARLTASGKGEFSPRANNSTAEGRASNRRTEIVLTPKLDEIMKLLNNK